MTRTPKNPAAEVTPVPHRRVARTVPGEPAVAPGPPRGTAAGGKTSTQPQERAAAGKSPAREADPAAVRRLPASPGRGQTPAVGADGAASAPSAGSRTYTIALPPGLPLLSQNGRIHHFERNRRVQVLKKAAWLTALKEKIPRLGRVSIVVEYQPRDSRDTDPDNVPPASGKPCIDGLVVAGVLPDDNSRYVVNVSGRIGPKFPRGRLVLHITEEPAATGGDAA